jgi:tetratricopeptide (TPR) repeat protein
VLTFLHSRLQLLLLLGFVFGTTLSVPASDQPQWIRVSSDHFSVLTDAPAKSGHAIVARFEQMRSIFAQLLVRQKVRMAQPLTIIALANSKEFQAVSPSNLPPNVPGFVLTGEDQTYVVLNASDPDCWRAIQHPLAHYFLNYNYPPTQPWFDEGFAEYFAGTYFTSRKAEFGSDPELKMPSANLLGDTSASGPGVAKSLTELLQAPVWLNLSDLLQMSNRVVNGQEGTHHTLFYAQSWMLMHYLLNQDKLSNAGTYFGLVEIQHVPIAQAVQQAFGMPVDQLDRAVKDYFRSLKPLAASLEESKRPNPPLTPEPVIEQAPPFTVEQVSDANRQIPAREAQALVNEMALRIPERRDAAMQALEKLNDDPKTETDIAHRALGWAYIQKGDTSKAFQALNSAMQIDSMDPWTRFGLALAAYHSGERGARIQGLANTMESLHIVINEYPDFAEAYNILGWARLTGGGGNAAVEAMKMAVQLGPRQTSYQLRLARAMIAAKQYDQATALLERLRLSREPDIAAGAKKDLEDLPFLKKYGMRPQDAEAQKPIVTGETGERKTADSDEDEDADEKPSAKADNNQPDVDKRPVKFLKSKLVSVDCSQAPVAIVSLSEAGKTLRLRAADYKSLIVIGGNFSCQWKNIPVNVNYRRGGKADGDLVSIEVQ